MIASRIHSVVLLAVFAAASFLAATAARADFEAGWRAYQQGDFSTAMGQWEPLAQQGDPAAQFNVGVLFHDGRGVATDPSHAVAWWRRAAEGGHAPAQYNLGLAHIAGDGVVPDPSAATRWLEKAALQGLARAQFALGRLYRDGATIHRDMARALMWLTLADEAGLDEARDSRTDLASRLPLETRRRAERLASQWRASRS